ncbi:uncharacterized protein TNCV_3274741 [Trichonephila clavipes]|nr:uncharacterized protein TNCV_3274741 [Trichonephila clavipes]
MRYSSNSVHWSRWSPSILAWQQIGQTSLAATPSQWRYTPKKSCPVVSRDCCPLSPISRYLGIGPTMARVSHGFPKPFVFLGLGSIFVNVCGDNVLCSSEGQRDFRLSQLGSLLGYNLSDFMRSCSFFR